MRGATREDNIQLNKEISGCGSTSRLCGLITKHAGEFNHVNVATAFRKLLLASRSGMPRGVVEDALEALEQRALQTMEDFGAREIANTLHSMAKARYRPTRAVLLCELGDRLRAVAGECIPQHIANTLWAYATMGERPGAGVVGALEGRLRAVAGECSLRQISDMLWACARLGLTTEDGLVGALEGQAQVLGCEGMQLAAFDTAMESATADAGVSLGQREGGSNHTSVSTGGEEASQVTTTQGVGSEPRREVTQSESGGAARAESSAARNANEKSLREMNAEEVAEWVRQVLAQEDSPSVQECVEEVVEAFRANMVSGVDVMELTSEDMREELGIRTLRVRKALNHAIRADKSGGV